MTEIYKRYRPKQLNRLVGNESTTRSLANMLERGTLPHTILFHGPSGTGKTTTARILRDRLDCHELDFIELNCSDFRGIDTVRDIARTMTLAPTAGPCRIWLLDECHQLSPQGQHAALKILEDTPNHVYFFLCTTNPEKLLKTIRTRCCEMPFRLLSDPEQSKLIRRVARKEKIDLDERTLDLIVDAAQGSPRTALVILDKISHLEAEDRRQAIEEKLVEENEAIDLCRALMAKRVSWPQITTILRGLTTDPESTRWAVLGYARSVLLKSRNEQAYRVIQAFEENFYDSKAAGLVRACYEATTQN